MSLLSTTAIKIRLLKPKPFCSISKSSTSNDSLDFRVLSRSRSGLTSSSCANCGPSIDWKRVLIASCVLRIGRCFLVPRPALERLLMPSMPASVAGAATASPIGWFARLQPPDASPKRWRVDAAQFSIMSAVRPTPVFVHQRFARSLLVWSGSNNES